MGFSKIWLVTILFVTLCLAVEPVKANLEALPKVTGNEIILSGGVPYLGGRQSPGDQIGTTWYDWQSFKQRIKVDDYGQAHIIWSDQGGCYLVFRFQEGYSPEVQCCPGGNADLDITRDADPDMQRTVVVYHYQSQSWIDIDAGNCWGAFPNNPCSPHVIDHIWPTVAATSNGNIILATGDYNAPMHHLYLTTDEGATWSYIGGFDSCGTLSQFVRSSHNAGSNKVVHAWTQYIEVIGSNDQLNNDVYYVLSNDGGVTWGSPVNITNYRPYSSILDTATWAYWGVNAVFDRNDNLHIVWGVYQAYVPAGTLYVLERAKIFHWGEVSNTISVVNSPSIYYSQPEGWWLDEYDRAGAWRMPADQPQLIIDPNSDTLFCLWHGQDDTTDYSAAGYFNGEFYGSYSTDNGLTWSDYVNLTNTRCPGAPAGACDDEDYMTAFPYVFNDSIFITYIEDKDAGSYPHGEGVATENPVRCWLFDKKVIGIEEYDKDKPKITTSLTAFPNPTISSSKISYTISHSSNVTIKLFDVAGRLVKDLDKDYKEAGNYVLNMSTNDIANGAYFILLSTSAGVLSHTNLFVLR